MAPISPSRKLVAAWPGAGRIAGLMVSIRGWRACIWTGLEGYVARCQRRPEVSRGPSMSTSAQLAWRRRRCVLGLPLRETVKLLAYGCAGFAFGGATPIFRWPPFQGIQRHLDRVERRPWVRYQRSEWGVFIEGDYSAWRQDAWTFIGIRWRCADRHHNYTCFFFCICL